MCQFVGVGGTLMDLLIWLNLWVVETPALRIATAVLGLMTWR